MGGSQWKLPAGFSFGNQTCADFGHVAQARSSHCIGLRQNFGLVTVRPDEPPCAAADCVKVPSNRHCDEEQRYERGYNHDLLLDRFLSNCTVTSALYARTALQFHDGWRNQAFALKIPDNERYRDLITTIPSLCRIEQFSSSDCRIIRNHEGQEA